MVVWPGAKTRLLTGGGPALDSVQGTGPFIVLCFSYCNSAKLGIHSPTRPSLSVYCLPGSCWRNGFQPLGQCRLEQVGTGRAWGRQTTLTHNKG